MHYCTTMQQMHDAPDTDKHQWCQDYIQVEQSVLFNIILVRLRTQAAPSL